MWCRFLEGFNGKVYFLEEEWHSDVLICSQIAQLNSVVGHISMGSGVSLVGPNIGNT